MEAIMQGKTADDVRAAGQEVQDVKQAAANETGERSGSARSRAEASMRNAQARLAEVGRDITVRARGAVRASDQYVHENPWQVLGIAAMSGFLIGYLLGRR